MRQAYWLTATAAVCALGAILGIHMLDAVAKVQAPGDSKPDQDGGKQGLAASKDAPVKQTPGQAQLPVTQIVLFSSGVGHFQREGEVEGNARVDLMFPAEGVGWDVIPEDERPNRN